MLKLTKTGIGLLTKQYRSVLRKCLLLNLGLFVATAILVTMTPKMGRTSTGIVTEGEIDQYTETNIYKLYYAKYTRASSRNSYLDVETSYTNTNAEVKGKYFDLETFLTDLSMGHLFKAGAISSHDIANGTIVNEDIADSTIKKAKLSSAVRTSLSLADTAVQSGANISIFNNDAGFITKSVNDLTNYYTKSETYSRNEIANLDSLNYYYTFWVDESKEVTDSASFFQKDFSTLREVDLHIKNPTHLGAFAKCDEVCPRPSERFSLSLSQEQMLKNDASVDAGTSRHCLRQFGDVVADLLKNMASKYAKMNDFMNVEVCHA